MSDYQDPAKSLKSMLLSELESGEFNVETLYKAVLEACQEFESDFAPAKRFLPLENRQEQGKAPIVININQ